MTQLPSVGNSPAKVFSLGSILWRSPPPTCFCFALDIDNGVSHRNCDGLGAVQSPELSTRGLGVRVNDPFGNVRNFAHSLGWLAPREQGQYFTLVPMTDAPRMPRLDPPRCIARKIRAAL